VPHPRTHLQPTNKPVPADDEWQPWNQAWTRLMPRLTGRTDLTVVVAPGAGGGAPACFYPDQRRVEVDATHIGTPQVADPRKAAHKNLVPTAYGLLIHEAGHAAHTRWDPPPATPPVVADVALLLEESRAEGRHRARRRGDRRWLRHAVTTLIHVEDAPVDDAWHAGQLAGLLLARVDARIITHKDARPARAAVTSVLGRKRLAQLREIWRQAHTVADTDAQAMVDLAWRWCRVLGIDPHTQPDVPVPDLGQFAGLLAAALTDYLAAAAGLSVAEYTARHIAGRYPAPAGWWRRDPTPAEHAAARQLADRLTRARATPEPAATPALLPPGRLRTRQAVTADAQAAAGATPTATPWQRRAHTPPPKPTLHLGVLVDVSSSMRAYAKPMSSAGWILAHAARRARAVTATIAFGPTTTLLVGPRQRPTQVLDMQTGGGTTTFIDAVKLADHLLGLRRTRSLRLLAVVSDGVLSNREPAQRLITTLHRAGCPVLWLHPANLSGHTFTHTTSISVADPLDAIAAISHAAIAAIANA
jgi:Mg-chelatase subunit ChlD